MRWTVVTAKCGAARGIYAVVLLLGVAVGGCGTVAPKPQPDPKPEAVVRAPERAASVPAQPGVPAQPSLPRRGGYYLDDGPGDNPPPNLDQTPDALPKAEILHRGAMRVYTVMGQRYTPMTALQPYKAQGIASWYGRRYHGQKTSSGEIYDMYTMTAAHPILPIPSYARVTNLQTGKAVVVKINDRGPFHSDRLIDLSYTAAYKLGVLAGGRARVEVETIFPGSGDPIDPILLLANAAAAASPSPPLGAAPASPVPLAVTAAPEPVEARPSMPVVTDRSGIFLQLGAFGSRENADNYLTRMRVDLEWLAPILHIHPKDGLFRVHAGPYANSSEARAAADRIGLALGLNPIVLTR